MIYKQKVEMLLDTLYNKILIIERVAQGTMPASANEVNRTIEESKKIVEQLAEIVSIER